jgi:DNA-binding response OmpR family regulator
MRVLIATGDVFAAATIREALAKSNLICDTTDLGRDALQTAEVYDYDIILLDLTRPDIEDYEVLRRLRASACARRSCRLRAFRGGACGINFLAGIIKRGADKRPISPA